MALPLLLRNACKLQGTSIQLNASKLASTAIFSNNFPAIQSTQRSNYSLLLNKNINNTNQFNVVGKRGIALSQPRLSGDHGRLWIFEKAVSVALMGLVPAAVIIPNPVIDNLLAVCVVAHLHWGLEACVVDYVRPILFGNLVPKLTMGLLFLLSATTLGGLIYFNVNDIGIGNVIRKIWALKAE